MTLDLIVPAARRLELEEAVAAIEQGRHRLAEPFSPEVLNVCAALSQAIARSEEARRYPELQALAFFMRRAALRRLADEFQRLETPETLLVARGTVFHVPPANVDTIFLYSWLLSILAGNRNVIRLSRRDSPQTLLLCGLFRQILGDHPELAENTFILQYEHEEEITAALSALCDVRVIWGGDRTVETIRRIPLPPHARELTFPDRFSMAALRSESALALSEAETEGLAVRLFNDIYWFDQMACSSPRLLIWEGSEENARLASAKIAPALTAQVRKRALDIGVGVSLEKFTFAARAAIDRPVARVNRYGAALTTIALDSLRDFSREHPGGGLWMECRVERLEELLPFIHRKDQTLTHFGFTREELTAFARRAAVFGIDRIVPAGEALNFNRFWDGMDLLREFTRCVYLQTAGAAIKLE